MASKVKSSRLDADRSGVATVRKLDSAPGAGAAAFAFALAADFATKAYAVAVGAAIFNDRSSDLARRLALTVAAVAVVALLARLARWRGLGPLRGAWVGVGVLAAGVIGNGLASVVWSAGVPDFIWLGRAGVWNLADFEIAVGLVGGLVSVAVTAGVRYRDERAAST
jgi:hypothetical protein